MNSSFSGFVSAICFGLAVFYLTGNFPASGLVAAGILNFILAMKL